MVTCKNGALKATTTVKYIPDRTRLVVGSDRYRDSLSGPDFDKKLAPDAILVFSHIVKEHGSTTKIRENISGSPSITEADTEGHRRDFDKNYDMGKYEYSYLWVNSDKGKGIKMLEKAIIGEIKKEYRGPLQALIKSAELDLGTYNGQMVFGDAGLDKRANLNGEPID